MRDDGASLLEKLFPGAPEHRNVKVARPNANLAVNSNDRAVTGRQAWEEVPTRWAAIYTLELRGLTQQAIAEAVNMSPGSVSRIVMDDRYIAYRTARLAELDQEFVAMKPLAFNALRGALNSQDENTALRASETWFKGAGFGGYSKTERPATTLTAEDVAAALLNHSGGPLVQVNTQVNTQVNAPSGDSEK
jgi:transcriptional regulator with XRE-family HTH domain